MLQILIELFQIISGREGLVRPIGGSVGRRRGPRHHLGWARGEHIVVQHRVPICGKALLVPRSLRGGREGENLCHYRAERMRQKHVSEGASWTIFCWGGIGLWGRCHMKSSIWRRSDMTCLRCARKSSLFRMKRWNTILRGHRFGERASISASLCRVSAEPSNR